MRMLPGFTAVLVAACVVVQADLPLTQKQALVDLYTATNGSGWAIGNANPWNPNTDPCRARWIGVFCSTDNATVL